MTMTKFKSTRIAQYDMYLSQFREQFPSATVLPKLLSDIVRDYGETTELEHFVMVVTIGRFIVRVPGSHSSIIQTLWATKTKYNGRTDHPEFPFVEDIMEEFDSSGWLIYTIRELIDLDRSKKLWTLSDANRVAIQISNEFLNEYICGASTVANDINHSTSFGLSKMYP